MALTNHPSGSIFNASGDGISLSNGLDLLIDPGIMVTTASGRGVVGAGSNSVVCNGAIGGPTGLYLNGSANHLTIGASGLISADETGVYFYGGNNSSIINNGVIFGESRSIYLNGSLALLNNGTITGGDTYATAVFFECLA